MVGIVGHADDLVGWVCAPADELIPSTRAAAIANRIRISLGTELGLNLEDGEMVHITALLGVLMLRWGAFVPTVCPRRAHGGRNQKCGSKSLVVCWCLARSDVARTFAARRSSVISE
ncbi:hypothetical protein BRAS3843_430024 [Bradyrhizobium sp. STM 3843]|nr:hypothetical protein BRAS3843_430024 [Bradyrhizobium sp. STM 3843]